MGVSNKVCVAVVSVLLALLNWGHGGLIGMLWLLWPHCSALRALPAHGNSDRLH